MAVKKTDRVKAYFGGETNQIADGSDVRDEAKRSLGGIPGFAPSNREDGGSIS